MIKKFLTQIKIQLVMILFTIFIYQFSITLLANLFAPYNAEGSLIKFDSEGVRGSFLILQPSNDPNLFYGNNNSSSHLDPFITAESAKKQLKRVAKQNDLEKERLYNLILQKIQYPNIVNVNNLNWDIDRRIGKVN